MNDLFISSKEIKNDLAQLKQQGIDLARNLSLLSQKIRYIFSQIKQFSTFEEAQMSFELLDEIQETLAILIFKEEIGIPDKLRRFVQDFDNLDFDSEYYFKKIKSGEYSF